MDQFVQDIGGHRYMAQALELARQSIPYSGINPAVGAVLVKHGTVIGTGFHRGPGTAHAEIAAIADAYLRSGTRAITQGAELWCSLEPCCHEGNGKRSPPCTQAIINAGIERVFVACLDPNPAVCGKGLAQLQAAGIATACGIMEEQGQSIIEPFTCSIINRRPFMRLKWAQTLDGKTACLDGSSRWISSPDSRTDAHLLRSQHQAIMIGAGTLRADNPQLTVRHVKGSDPLRIIMAGKQPLPLTAHILQSAQQNNTLVVAGAGSLAERNCSDAGIQYVSINFDQEQPNAYLNEVLETLYRRGIGSILVEGGTLLHQSFLLSGLWDAASVYCAPSFMGPGLALPLASHNLQPSMRDIQSFRLCGCSMSGNDVKIELRNPKGTACLPV